MRPFTSLAVVGVVAAVAVYALYQVPAGNTLYSTHEIKTEDMMYMRYISKYGKSYGTKEEFEFRADLFKSTLQQIAQENSKNDNTFYLGTNLFADWTPAEYKRLLGYKRRSTHLKAEPYTPAVEGDLPKSVDWRENGAVNPVKDQGMCGSCWSFSATSSMESRNFIKNGKLLSLSEQQLVDCAVHPNYVSEGCNGGEMYDAIQYAADHGQMFETDYRYTAKDGQCKYDSNKVQARPTGFKRVAPSNPQALKAAIAEGPVSVALEADTFIFQFYNGGILNSKTCGNELDHAVVAVGYGNDNGKEYYIVRNSWGASWGVDGYIHIAIVDGEGICGIQLDPVYPTF